MVFYLPVSQDVEQLGLSFQIAASQHWDTPATH